MNKFYIGELLLPQNPESVKVTYKANSLISEIVSLGEIIIPKENGLLKMEFSAIFTVENDPELYIAGIEEIMKNKKPVRIIITETGINILAIITGFQYSLIGGNGDVAYSLSVSEYKTYSASIVKEDTSLTAKTDRQGEPDKPATYTVIKGDTLWGISKRFLGDGSRYKELISLNGLKSDIINIGQVIRLP